MDDPLTIARVAEEPDPVLVTILFQVLEHRLGEFVLERTRTRIGWDDVVDRGKGPFWETYAESVLGECREGLRTRHLVDQVQADEKLALSAPELANRVKIPDFIEQIAAHAPQSSSSCRA